MGNKYNAQRTTVDGISFDSKKEAERYCGLKLLQRAGQIRDLTLQPEFPVWINGVKCFVYRSDFSYIENHVRVVEDVKSGPTKTPVYRLKKKCVEAYHGIVITEWPVPAEQGGGL